MLRNPKITTLAQLAEITTKLRASSKSVVHCHGTFDPLHIGHIRHFEQAKSFGDVLIVTVTPDRFVNKGPQRPVFKEELRAQAIAALTCVSYVAVNDTPTAVETIELLRPDVYVKGSEYADAQQDRTGGIVIEEAAVTRVGGRLAFTYDLTFSASNLVNHHLQVLSREVSEYLGSFSTRYSPKDVIRYLEQIRGLRVLLVGEAIVDEYQYCEAIGKSSKEPTLAVKQLNSERFAGGILAVANHLASFSDAHVLALLGDQPSHEDFIRANLNEHVMPRFVYRRDAPTILKRRFVESYFFTKMLEVYEIDDSALAEADEQAVCAALEELVPQFDVVEVADFGHSMLTDSAIEILSRKARFLAINVQSNAGNFGYHTLARYPRANYVSVNENEIRLEARDRRGDLQGMVTDIAGRLGGARIAVTQGKRGCLCYAPDEGFVQVPALTTQVVDRVGAGDAFLAITAPCVALDAPMEVVAFIGNAVGAQAVASVGNRRAVERIPLFRQIESLLK
jgi:rfaE bifunctional protein nucleotidyltransferase chain/domain